MPGALHADEIAITGDLVHALVDNQFPEFRHHALTPLETTGSTNRLFRLGRELLVRLPRQPGAGDTIDKEVRWLPIMANHLPVTVPEIVEVGEPALGYPERWSIVRWIDGTPPSACDPNTPSLEDRTALAEILADVILALRAINIPRDAASDPGLRWYRGRPLAEFDGPMCDILKACHAIDGLDLDLNAAERLWANALVAPEAHQADPDQWFHSDLVAENVLVSKGQLTGVLDFGCLSIGDPTIDLHGAWELFDPAARDIFRTRLKIDDVTWNKGRAWALAIALSVFSYYWKTMPKRCADRLAMARNVLAGT